VSFAPSVADRPWTSRVTVVEEPSAHTRMAPSASASTCRSNGGSEDGGDRGDIPPCAVAAKVERNQRTSTRSTDSTTAAAPAASSKRHVEFAADAAAEDEMSTSQKSDHLGNGGWGCAAAQYDSLTISLGLLKCGYRYQTMVPIYVSNTDAKNMQFHVVEIGESLDPDLEVHAVKGASDNGDGARNDAVGGDHIQIRIAARRPGKYQAGLSVLAVQRGTDPNADKMPQKHVVSIRIQATLLGKDQGKPQLKANIVKLGKVVGYDSDEETEWQGFPDDDSNCASDDGCGTSF
jgi:hypothetical protein